MDRPNTVTRRQFVTFGCRTAENTAGSKTHVADIRYELNILATPDAPTDMATRLHSKGRNLLHAADEI